MCQLTGQEVANASMYDGSTAMTEAVLMAERFDRPFRALLVARSIHPEYRDGPQDLRPRIAGCGLKKFPIRPSGTIDEKGPAYCVAE